MFRRWRHDNHSGAAEHALDRFWERIVRSEGPAPDDALDPGLAAAVRRLHDRDDTPGPNPDFADQLLEELMGTAASFPASSLVPLWPEFAIPSPNGHSAPRHFAPPQSRMRPIRQHSWNAGQLATAAMVVLTLFGSFFFISSVMPGSQDAPTTPADVATYKGNAAHTGENPGPGPAGKPVELWRLETRGDVRSSPAVVGGVVYVGSGDGNVYALDAISGVERWTFATAGPIASSPTVANGLVFIGSEDRTLYALDAATGTERWRLPDAGANVGTVVVDETVYVGTDAGLIALDTVSGDERWRFTAGGAVVRAPALVDEVIYAGSADGQINALDPEDGAVIWQYQTDGGVMTTPTVAGGIVFQAAIDGPADRLYALDTSTGAERWRFSLGTAVLSPTVGGGMLYAPTTDRALYALDAASGTLRWRFASDDDITASPALVGDTLYVTGRDGNLYALNAVSGSEQWRIPVGDSGIAPVVTGGMVYVPIFGGALVALGDPAAATAGETILAANSPSTPAPALADAPVAYAGQITGDANPLLAPSSSALDAQGNLYVSDLGHNRVVKFASDGTVLASWGSHGSNPGQFLQPSGIVIDVEGNSYVADNQRSDVQKFAPDGTFLLGWGSRGVGNGQLDGPGGLAIDAEGRVWIADFGNNRIQVFDADGAFLFAFGSRGSDDGQLAAPNAVALDAEGNAYVSECDNHRVSKFAADGTFLFSWDHEFRCLAGIYVDEQGRIYVADADNQRIQVFEADGTFVTMWGEAGPGEGQFVAPIGVAVDGQGHVYVTDIEANRILAFRLLPPLAPEATPEP